jgi:adenylate cyclase
MSATSSLTATIFGDGVNIAARLEALAEAGGLFLSAAAYDQIRDRVDTAFEDLGEQQVKNIPRPVRVYRALLHEARIAASPTSLPPPDKPSIAVLAFTNMTDEIEQEYFADGIAEDIITELSKSRSLFVIARNSSFTYKGRNVSVKDISRELGVRYVLEGSVRKAGNRVRVTAQLIEATTSGHLWAARDDREKQGLAPITALGDMPRRVRHNNARDPGHPWASFFPPPIYEMFIAAWRNLVNCHRNPP